MRTSSFLTSTSGYVSTREGASLGWMAGAVAGTAVIFGMASPAAADECGGAPPGNCLASFCSSDPCAAFKTYEKQWCRTQSGSCELFTVGCNCNV